MSELVLDHALEERSRHGARDRAEDQQPREPFVRGLHGTLADRADPGAEVQRDVGTEVDQGADQRSHVERDVEGLVERRVVDDVPPEEPRDEDQVAGARDRSELRQSLGDAEHDRLENARRASLGPGRARDPERIDAHGGRSDDHRRLPRRHMLPAVPSPGVEYSWRSHVELPIASSAPTTETETVANALA